jgi:hypothetical protein
VRLVARELVHEAAEDASGGERSKKSSSRVARRSSWIPRRAVRNRGGSSSRENPVNGL